MREITVILAGAQWGTGLMLFINPDDETKQGWFHVELMEGGEAILQGYSKGRRKLTVNVKEAVAEDLHL